MTGCEEIRPLISSYVDGEASAEEVALVQKHLKACDKCESHLAFLKMLGPAINHATIAAPSPLLFERIAKATYARPTWQQRYLGWLAPVSLRWTVGSGLVAAGIVAILVAPRVMQVTPEAPDAATIAVNKTVTPTPIPAESSAKPAPIPTPPETIRPAVTPPTPAPIAARPAETRPNTRIEPVVVAEPPAKRVAMAPKITTSAKPRVEAAKPTKSAPPILASNKKPDVPVASTAVKPSPLPTPPAKTTEETPILTAAAKDRDTVVSNPGPAAISKSVTIAANTVRPETPSFTPSAEPEVGSGGSGGRKGFYVSLQGANSNVPSELTNVHLRPTGNIPNSGIVSVAHSPVK